MSLLLQSVQLSFQNDHIRSKVLGKDINISMGKFARLLRLSYEGADIYNVNLNDFEYPDCESALNTSLLLRDDENLALLPKDFVHLMKSKPHLPDQGE